MTDSSLAYQGLSGLIWPPRLAFSCPILPDPFRSGMDPVLPDHVGSVWRYHATLPCTNLSRVALLCHGLPQLFPALSCLAIPAPAWLCIALHCPSCHCPVLLTMTCPVRLYPALSVPERPFTTPPGPFWPYPVLSGAALHISARLCLTLSDLPWPVFIILIVIYLLRNALCQWIYIVQFGQPSENVKKMVICIFLSQTWNEVMETSTPKSSNLKVFKASVGQLFFRIFRFVCAYLWSAGQNISFTQHPESNVKKSVKTGPAYSGTQEPGRGGGAVGQISSPNLVAVGAPPTYLWTVNVVHFYFCSFLLVNLNLFQKVGQIRGVFWVGVTLNPPGPENYVPYLETIELLQVQEVMKFRTWTWSSYFLIIFCLGYP